MSWQLQEAMDYYRRQGAPGDQNALTALLREIQQEFGGIPLNAVGQIAEGYGLKESYLLAIIRRIPRLRLQNKHTLELCAGPNCGKHTALAKFAEGLKSEKLEVKFISCQRQCGKGPNIRFDGRLYNKADEKLLTELINGI